MNGDLTDQEVDRLLERFDQTEPALQRRIVAQLIAEHAVMSGALQTQNQAIKDLALLTQRLAWKLAAVDPTADLPAKAFNYLKRKGLQGSILRGSGEIDL